MSLIALKSDHIIKADQVYYDLERFGELFAHEALVIDRAKCLLLQEGDLENYMAKEIYVSVDRNSDGFDLHYDSCVIHLSVYERQIINFYVQKIY